MLHDDDDDDVEKRALMRPKGGARHLWKSYIYVAYKVEVMLV